MCEIGIYIARNNSPNPGGLVHVEPVHRVGGGVREEFVTKDTVVKESLDLSRSVCVKTLTCRNCDISIAVAVICRITPVNTYL